MRRACLAWCRRCTLFRCQYAPFVFPCTRALQKFTIFPSILHPTPTTGGETDALFPYYMPRSHVYVFGNEFPRSAEKTPLNLSFDPLSRGKWLVQRNGGNALWKSIGLSFNFLFDRWFEAALFVAFSAALDRAVRFARRTVLQYFKRCVRFRL